MYENEFILKRSNINAQDGELFGDKCVILKGVKAFSIEKTFDCGQCFRFDPVTDDRFDFRVRGIAYGKLIEIARKDDLIYLFGTDVEEYRSLWRHFLGLDMNYPKLCDTVLKANTEHPIIGEAYSRSEGIRILCQEHWETLCSFIISQNNNIPRIKNIIERLCRMCGERFIGYDGSECYAFPTPEAVIKEGVYSLKEIGTGFRAKYIIDAAERIVNGRTDFGYIEDCDDTEECIRHLCEIYGVGVKVASCTLLFSFEKYDTFPKDVWIKRIMDKHFGADFDPAALGGYRGLVQQWLFYNGRWGEDSSVERS